MREPSIGQAIGLQGRDQFTERIGNLAYQAQQADLNRQLKLSLTQAKLNAEEGEKALKKFELPSGKINRLLLKDFLSTQTKYVDELKKLKTERPNDWQNGVNDLALKYEQEMTVLTTRSRDLDQYEILTASEDKGNTYQTKNAKIFNNAYETANTYEELLNNLEKQGFQADAQIQFRPIGSVSYTPFVNKKPKETLEQNITQMITQLPFKSNESKKAYGYVQGKEVKVRPVTYEPSDLGVSAVEIARYNNVDPQQVPSIEGVVDNFLMAPDGGVQSIVQYADQNNLRARFDEQGQLIPEDYQAIKGHIMNWAKNFASPGITTSMMRPQTMVLQGKDEEVSSAMADISPSEIASKEQGQKSYKLGIINYSFDKEPQSIPVNPSNTFTSDFKPAPNTTLTKVQADGVIILAVDAKGQPIRLEQDPKKNKQNIAGADVFVRLRDAEGFYYQKFDKYSNISNTFMKKPNGQLEQEVNKLLKAAAKYDVEIAKRKKDPNATFEQIVVTPTF